jgi:hypothetical protein
MAPGLAVRHRVQTVDERRSEDEAQRPKALEEGNGRIKPIVAEPASKIDLTKTSSGNLVSPLAAERQWPI